MRTLYVSDLDGTLFTSQKRLTDRSVEIINKCIEKGMMFTVATARMPFGCDYKLTSLNLATPAILTNGVFLYTFSNQQYVNVESIVKSAVPRVIEAFRKNDASCFMYAFSDNRISIYYDDEKLEEQTQYYSARALETCREVKLVRDNLEHVAGSRIVYMALTGTEAELLPIKDDLGGIPGVNFAFYLNIYNGLYCLEVFSANASKKNALGKLREHVDFDELVVFGDNLNDLSMIEIADRSYAPGNALPEVKVRVTEVLADCDNDGVAMQLAKEYGIAL